MYRESSTLVVVNPAHRPATSHIRFPIQIHVLPPIKYLKDIFVCRIFTMFGHASLHLVIIIIHVIYKFTRYENLPMDEIPQVTHHRSIAPLVVPKVPHQSFN